MQDLITYRVNAVRKQKSLRRLMGLGRGLTHDELDENSQKEVIKNIVNQMKAEINNLKKSGDFEKSAKEITGVDLKTITLQGTITSEESAIYTIDAVNADIDYHFEQAGRLFSNGLHKEYWKANAKRDASEVKVEAIVLAKSPNNMQALEKYAESEFNLLYEKYKRDIAKLNEQRRQHYDKLRLATAKPETIAWHLPESIPFKRSTKATLFEKHLYLEEKGDFKADLGSWERGVIEEELADDSVIAWLRNVDRQNWSLEIPYRSGGEIKSMFPDMLVIRQDEKEFLFDILEPHDSNRDDNADKVVGLAEFAEKHWKLFDRIQLIRKKRAPDGKERYYRLDVGKEAVRKKVLAVESNNQLDSVFDEEAKLKK